MKCVLPNGKVVMPTTFVVVSDHKNLPEYLMMKDIIPLMNPSEYLVLGEDEVTEDKAYLQNIIGSIPMRIAEKASSYTEVIIKVPPELKGKDLTLEEIDEYILPTKTYSVEVEDRSEGKIVYAWTLKEWARKLYVEGVKDGSIIPGNYDEFKDDAVLPLKEYAWQMHYVPYYDDWESEIWCRKYINRSLVMLFCVLNKRTPDNAVVEMQTFPETPGYEIGPLKRAMVEHELKPVY